MRQSGTRPLQGAVDKYDAGFVSGWVWNPNDRGTKLEVDVLIDDQVVGSGVADLYRNDLAKANIGNGRFAFRVKITPPRGVETVNIVVVEKEARQPISDTPLSVELATSTQIVINQMQWGLLSGQVKGPGLTEEQLTLTICSDECENPQVGTAAKVAECVYSFRIPIPTRCCDGNIHLLTVALEGYPGVETNYVDVIPSSITPWDHLSASAKELSFPPLARTAGYRYDSLQRQLHEQPKGVLDNILQAHDVVVDGWENRKKFPELRLPYTETPDVSIIIPVHNKFALTYHCLASLILAWNRASYEVILVDDCSTDETVDLLNYVDNVNLIVNEDNLGFLRNCNKAAKEAKGRYLVMLNNDTEVTSGWLDEMLATFERFEGVGMAGSKLIYPDGKLQEAGGIVWGNGQPWNLGNGGNPEAPEWNYARQADYLSGASFMVPKTLWDELEGFSDEFAPAYYEDTDFAFKVRSAGYKTLFVPHSVVVHFEGMSNGRDVTKGIKKNQALNAPKFRAKWIDSYMYNGIASLDKVRFNKDRNVAYRVLMLDYAVPRPDHDAGSYAAVQEMRMLQANGCKVSFLAENLSYMGKYTKNLNRMGVETFYAPFQTSVEQVLQERGDEFDVVYITRYDVAERHLENVRRLTNAKIVFNNADLHFLRELRAALAANKQDLSGPLATRDRELALMRNVDAILSYNPTEHAVIASHNLREDNLFLCPWVLDGRGHNTGYAERSGIGFLGGFKHTPNVEAVEFFAEQVMPLLRKRLPGVKFHIYGSSMPDSFKKYEADDVVLEGFVENLDEVFENRRLIVAPLLSGAGIKGKVLEAMSAGVPQVLTPVAAEATGLTHGVSAMIVEEPGAWAEVLTDVYENEAQWARLSENSLALAQSNFSFENGVKGMKRVLEGVGVYPPNRIRSLSSV
ncbi:glycosyltransferase [Marinimicrobium sp. ARAG 43.8]|uniref:glycosyltransferase n=1 Tax=Marinimicrobium sp. ARAG 43.8 TaxID=3418719 RepID=UPI003CF18861